MGCVILDPVATGVDSKCAEFGAGCSRWIQFYVGSHGEFGKTPAWASIDSIRKEMGLSNFRLTLTSAVSLSRTLGATHVAVGEMSGAAGNLTIVYKVYVLATPNTPVATVTLSGSEQAIIDGLPAAASRITRALGLATPRIPQRCKATENGLRLMGKVGWVPTTQDHSEDL